MTEGMFVEVVIVERLNVARSEEVEVRLLKAVLGGYHSKKKPKKGLVRKPTRKTCERFTQVRALSGSLGLLQQYRRSSRRASMTSEGRTVYGRKGVERECIVGKWKV